MASLTKIVESTLIPHTAFKNAVSRVEQCFRYADDTPEPIGLAVIGESRAGKSRVIEEVESIYPRFRSAGGLEVPILRVKVRSGPTVKGLTELMLRAMDDPRWGSSGSEGVKTGRLQTLLKNAKTKMVVLDEFQHFYDKGSHKVMHHVADYLKVLMDECKVALVVAGLPTCTAVIEQNEQLAGRFLSPVFIPRFNWLVEDDRADFTAILAAFQESLGRYFDLPELGSDDMAFRCYCASGGLIGYLAKTLRQAVWDACDDSDRRTITLEDLEHAHQRAVWQQVGLMGIESPFCRTFSVQPSLEIISNVQTIGTRLDSEEDGRVTSKPRRRRSPKSDVTTAQVLSTR